MKNKHIKRILQNNLFTGIFSAFFLIVSAAFNIFMAFVLGKIIESSLALDLKMFQKNILLIIFIIILAGLSELLGQNLKFRFAKMATIEYKELLANNLLKSNFKSFQKNNTSYYLNILVEETQVVENHYFLQLISILQNIVQAVIGISALIFINWKFTLCTLLVFFIPVIIPGFLGKILGKKNIILTEQKEQFIVGVKGILEGFELIKTHGLQEKILQQYQKLNKNVENANYDFFKIDNTKDVIANSLGTLSQMAAIAIGVFFIFQGEMTVPLLFAGIQIIGNIMNPISVISQRYAWIISTKPILNKHLELISTSSDHEAMGDHIENINDITVEHLSFSYGEQNIINDVSYHFEKGKKYVIIGESGSGKSTFLKLLMGYFENYTGNIRYSQKDLKQINYGSLYQNISVMHQNVFLFEDTLENNVKLFRPVDEDVYQQALLKANLMKVKERLLENNSIIKDNGTNLSGGEKQRIAIARCLVNKSEVLFIDEATASLDPENSRMFYNIVSEFTDTTCIAITHERDRNILKCFDEILLLKNGKIRKVDLDSIAN